MLCFFLCVLPFFLHVCLHLRQVHFCCSRLLCFRVVDSAGFSLCFPPFPPFYLLLRYCICNFSLFRFCSVLFACVLIILKHNDMLLFLPLVLLVLQGRVILAGSVCFCFFLFCSFCLLVKGRQCFSGLCLVALCLLLVAFFQAGLLFFFLFCIFLLFATRGEYRRPGPCGHSNAFFACPPILDWSTTTILAIHEHLCTSDLVCVPVVSVHVCFRSWPHVVRSYAYVFPGTQSV